VDQEENYATVGIENEVQTAGLLMNYANIPCPTAHSLENETAILYKLNDIYNIPILTRVPAEISITLNPNDSVEKEILIFNHSEDEQVSYEISFSHFRKGRPARDIRLVRNIENDTLLNANNTGYVAYIEQNLVFYLYHDPESEPVSGVSLDFPAGVFVESAIDLECLSYNEETGDGVEVTWGFGDETLSEIGFHSFAVNVEVNPEITSVLDIDWLIQGDGSGSEPNIKTGTISIQPAEGSYLWITHPERDDQLIYGLEDSITWVDWGEEISPINIELSFDNEQTWEILAEEITNENYYYFTVPAPLSDECKVRISGLDGSILDYSDIFSITALNVIYPNDNSILQYNCQDTIKWIDCGDIENVDIDISSDGGNSWDILAENIENDGAYEFIVPGYISDYCIIRLTDSNGVITNKSSGYFSIVDFPVDWIVVDSTSGSIGSGEVKSLCFTISSQELDFGTYSVFIKIRSEIGQILRIPVSLEVTEEPPPEEDFLAQNCPNPISQWTSFPFVLKNGEQKDVTVEIYNVKGRLVKTLKYDNSSSRYGDEYDYIPWDTHDNKGNKVSTGIYFYQLKIKDKVIDTKKCLILR